MFVKLFDRITADDSPASYWFVCAVAGLILTDSLGLFIFDVFYLLRAVSVPLVHAAMSLL